MNLGHDNTKERDIIPSGYMLVVPCNSIINGFYLDINRLTNINMDINVIISDIFTMSISFFNGSSIELAIDSMLEMLVVGLNEDETNVLTNAFIRLVEGIKSMLNKHVDIKEINHKNIYLKCITNDCLVIHVKPN